jgi:hypothetical protein
MRPARILSNFFGNVKQGISDHFWKCSCPIKALYSCFGALFILRVGWVPVFEFNGYNAL